MDNQSAVGAWGLPYAWGRYNGHFGLSVPEHYANGRDHPAGSPYAINALIAGRGLLHRRNRDGSINYTWCQANQPDFYTYAVASGLIRYATLHSDTRVLEAGRRMMSWRSNMYPPGGILSEPEGVGPLGLDNTSTVTGYLQYSINTQHSDGSWSSGTAGRAEADKLNAMTLVLVQAGYHTSAGSALATSRRPELLLSDPAFTPLAVLLDARRNPHRYYP